MTPTFSNERDRAGSLLPPRDVLRRLAVSESGFVFDPASGNSFTVNETGLAILRGLQNSPDLQALSATLLRDYDIKPRDLERDLLEFAGTLREYFGNA
jgi:PqqD family protein of HPr-rel-A system